MSESIINCKLKTLTPVHIATDSEYGSSEFIIDKLYAKKKNKEGKIEKVEVNVLKRISIDKYFLKLSSKEQKQFLKDLTNKKFNLENGIKKYDIPISKEFTRYISYLKSPRFSNDIKENVKTLDEIYIPGSSIKGAIKTALLYEIINETDVHIINNMLIKFFDKRSHREKTNVDYRKYNGWIDNIFSNTSRNSAQYSIMRFLQISDTSTIKNPSVFNAFTLKAKESSKSKEDAQVHDSIDSFEVWKKSNKSSNWNKQKSKISPKSKEDLYDIHRGSSNYLETTGTGKLFNFNMNLTFNKSKFKDLAIQDKENIISLDNIKESLYKFSNDYIDYEIKFAEMYEIEKLGKTYKQIKKSNSLESPLIRLGAGSGFLGTTIGMKIKEFDEDTFKLVSKSAYKYYDFEFPKSRKLIKDSYTPLGWAKLIFS
ncbi:MAG: type III-A CRISPR-associated RAMP protein Csm5 [Methanobacteriaceae archaeon]